MESPLQDVDHSCILWSPLYYSLQSVTAIALLEGVEHRDTLGRPVRLQPSKRLNITPSAGGGFGRVLWRLLHRLVPVECDFHRLLLGVVQWETLER